LWRYRKDLGFPEPDVILSRRAFWRRATVEAWIAAQVRRGVKTVGPLRRTENHGSDAGA
jgi:hypothetical protein